jgi:hypothetical protein
MKPVVWMVAVSAVSWLLVSSLAGERGGREVLFGMLGPLASAVVSWIAYERAYRSAPGRLTGVMIAALAAKMAFFGAFLFVMLRGLELRPVPFVASFTGYFLALHAMEALFLRRLVMNDLRPPAGGRA